MQFIILGSAFIMVLLQDDITFIPIAILVVVKTVLDFIAHKNGHKVKY